jgi:diguanylate cyclase (GGDEF)-like protein
MVSVLFIELDRFKSVNQTWSSPKRMNCACSSPAGCRCSWRRGDTLARVGTDQFAVLLPDIQDPQEPLRMAQAILDALRIPYRVGQREVRLTASIGISTSPQDGDDAPTLQKEAEHATDRAKASGGNSIQCTTLTLSEASFERQQMESFLGQAILKNEMQVFYQPQTIADGSIFGMEALLRWEHPVLGTVPPSKFVPLAEENQFIHAMGEWTLATACRQAAIWQAMSPRPVKLAVNVSPIQLTQPRWVDFVARTLRECRLSPSCLELEITESTLLKNAKTSQTILHDLRALGVHFGIDDFGTGYSSLSYLHQLPIDTLKIDQTFVRGMSPASPGSSPPSPSCRPSSTWAGTWACGWWPKGWRPSSRRTRSWTWAATASRAISWAAPWRAPNWACAWSPRSTPPSTPCSRPPRWTRRTDSPRGDRALALLALTERMRSVPAPPLHARAEPGHEVCSLDFSSGPIIPCRWLRNRSFRCPGFAPTHFGSPGQAPTHTFASNFPSSQAAGGKSEAFAVLQTAEHPVIRPVQSGAISTGA